MNYRHAYHAGNFADVHKHVALTAILLHLKRKTVPFAAIDTHAGSGLYDLTGREARKSGEALEGIGRLQHHAPETAALAIYLDTVRAFGGNKYPGSPLIVAALLRDNDRLIAIEKHPEEFERLRRETRPYPHIRPMLGDGFEALPKLLPPPQRRGLILIDPPYEEPGESVRVATILAESRRRFATGIYMVWLPVKSRAFADSMAGELRSAGFGKLLFLKLDVARRASDSPERLAASGLLVLNPPYGFDLEMERAQAELLPLLARDSGACADAMWMG